MPVYYPLWVHRLSKMCLLFSYGGGISLGHELIENICSFFFGFRNRVDVCEECVECVRLLVGPVLCVDVFLLGVKVIRVCFITVHEGE